MLTDRQLLILQVIIDDFIQSAHPVGSKTLAKKGTLSLSSATIRNEMADLEELGYIEKTHTSSGRVPSEKGYRFYVDHLLSPQKLNNEEMESIRSLFMERVYEFETIVERSAHVLSELTDYTVIVLGPEVKDHKVSRLQIIPLNEEMAVAIIVTNTGHVEKTIFSIPPNTKPGDIEKINNILNSKLIGVPLLELKSRLNEETYSLLRKHLDNVMIIDALNDMLNLPLNDQVFYGGKTNMLKQPEFRDFEKIQKLFDFIEENQGFFHLLKKMPNGIQVRIGKEINVREMDQCSLITATYSIGDEQCGTIAILGPKRMNYGKVISLLNIFSNKLTNVLTELYYGKRKG